MQGAIRKQHAGKPSTAFGMNTMVGIHKTVSAVLLYIYTAFNNVVHGRPDNTADLITPPEIAHSFLPNIFHCLRCHQVALNPG
jgi:hypothetical protein